MMNNNIYISEINNSLKKLSLLKTTLKTLTNTLTLIKKPNLKFNVGIIVISSASVFVFTGCSTKYGCENDNTKCFASNSQLFSNNTSQINLNPNFDYIRLTLNGKVAWLAKGAVDNWPSANSQVYYSADRSVFRWSNGRLVAVTTPEYNWREYTNAPINWMLPKPLSFSRTIDTIEGHLAVPEQRKIVSSEAPQHHNFIEEDFGEEGYDGEGKDLLWMHEVTISKSESLPQKPSFDSWYAFDIYNMNEPIYGQQCISSKYCLSWQVWNKK